MSAATGNPGQGHLVYAPNGGAWWLLYLTSTQGLSALYSGDFSTWSAPASGSPYTLTAAHGSEGRSFGFSIVSAGTVDALHMVSAYSGVGTYHSRFTLATSALSNTNAESSVGVAISPSGCSVGADASKYVYDIWPNTGGNAQADVYPNSDTSSTWTQGSPTVGSNVTSANNYTRSTAVFLSGSGAVTIGDNGQNSASFTTLTFDQYSSGTWGGRGSTGLTVTTCPFADWGVCARTSSDAHLVALSNASNAFVHSRYNGSNWSSGNSLPTLTLATNSGVALASDGTDVWAFAIDSSYNVCYCKWTAATPAWDAAWTTLDTGTGSSGRAYVSATYSAGATAIGVIWTETVSSNYSIYGHLLSLGSGSPAVLAGTINASTSLAAGLTASSALASTAAASTSLTGSILATSALASSVGSSTSLTAGLTASSALASTIAASTTTVAGLTASSVLAGSVAATSSITGTIAAASALTASVVGTTSATAGLTVSAVLAGTVVGTTTTTGTLSSGGLPAVLVGSVAATSIASGSLAASAALAGSVAATTTTTAALLSTATLAGSIVVVTVAHGLLAGTVVLLPMTLRATLRVTRTLRAVLPVTRKITLPAVA